MITKTSQLKDGKQKGLWMDKNYDLADWVLVKNNFIKIAWLHISFVCKKKKHAEWILSLSAGREITWIVHMESLLRKCVERHQNCLCIVINNAYWFRGCIAFLKFGWLCGPVFHAGRRPEAAAGNLSPAAGWVQPQQARAGGATPHCAGARAAHPLRIHLAGEHVSCNTSSSL